MGLEDECLCMDSFHNATEHRGANHSYVYSCFAVRLASCARSCRSTKNALLILSRAPMFEGWQEIGWIAVFAKLKDGLGSLFLSMYLAGEL